jgi:hypothetical protein
MKNVPRHSVDLELVEEGVEGMGDVLDSLLDSAKSRAEALSPLLATARNYAGYLAVEQPESAGLCRSLRIGAQASAAIFATATGQGEVEARIDGAYTRLPATGVTDATHIANWRIGWWMAQIVRDSATIDQLVVTPVDILRQSSTRADECQYLFAAALQAFEQRAEDWATKLRVALDATDPDEVDLMDEDFVLNILVPEMQMLFRLAIGEIEPFQEALYFALQRHKKYWSRASRKRNPDGFFALGPVAIAGMARDAGMPIEVESAYLPPRLVTGQCREP